jgi:hypothetical protein
MLVCPIIVYMAYWYGTVLLIGGKHGEVGRHPDLGAQVPANDMGALEDLLVGVVRIGDDGNRREAQALSAVQHGRLGGPLDPMVEAAAPGAFGETGHGARLTAARACWVEAGFSRSDCAALLWVARTRAARVHRGWLPVLYRYSAIHGSGKRAQEARRFWWYDVPGKSPAFNEQWSELRDYVSRVLAGVVDTPCHGASHWGSRRYPTDVRRARRALKRGEWRVVECEQKTSNAFYAEVAP